MALMIPHTPISIRAAVAAVFVVGLTVTACGSKDDSSAGSGGSSTMDMSTMATTPATSASAATSAATTAVAPAGANTITITSFNFGSPITVKPGATVTVINKDTAPHDVDADDGKSFNTTPVSSATFTFTAPMTPGSYAFHCSVHAQMKGTLIVAA